jgi:hypothetical protein
MRTTTTLRWTCPALLLAASAPLVVADGSLDGLRGANYGSPAAAQESSVISILSPPFTASFTSDTSTSGGVDEFLATDFKSDGDTVKTGFEFSFELSEIGWNGSDDVKVAAWMNGQNSDFLSNQVVGGLPASFEGNIGNNGGQIPVFNFDETVGSPTDYSPGQQFVTVTNTVSGAGIVIDGVIDNSAGVPDGNPVTVAPYGAPLYENLVNPTGFADNNNPDVDLSTGSEINAIRAVIDDQGTPGNFGDDVLHVHIAGNLESNFNKLDIFIDAVAGAGQNPLLASPDPSYAGTFNMRSSSFDVDFGADYYLRYTTGIGGTSEVEHYFDCVLLGDGSDNGAGTTLSGAPKNDPGNNPLLGTGANGIGNISGTIDNSNLLGVSGPGEGIGLDQAFEGDPSLVEKGMEMVIDLDALGWDGSRDVLIGGWMSLGDQLSNQVIGGLPENTETLGAGDVLDFNTFAGDQFVTLLATDVVADGSFSLDGDRAGEPYVPLYINDRDGKGNSTTLRASTVEFDPTPGAPGSGDEIDVDVDRSQIDGVYAVINQVTTMSGVSNQLHIFVAGRFNQSHRLALFFDTKDGGQNQLADDNPDVGLNYWQNQAGLTFDSAFVPNFSILYNRGETFVDDGGGMPMSIPFHFADALELLPGGADDPDGPPAAGVYGGGDFIAGGPNDVVDPITGNLVNRSGFGNNTNDELYVANGSEADNVSFWLDTNDDLLYIHMGGNLETNFTKLQVFLDVIPFDGATQTGGQNTLIYSEEPRQIEDPGNPGSFIPNPNFDGNPEADGEFDALQTMGGPFPIPDTMPQEFEPGLTFDADFNCDYFIYLGAGNITEFPGEPPLEQNQWEIFGGITRLRGALKADPATGSGTDPGAFTNWGMTSVDNFGEFSDVIDAGAFLRNDNLLGVAGGVDQFEPDDSDPATVTTGMEIAIPINNILVPVGANQFTIWDGGQDGTPFKVMVAINGGFHSFFSNQFLPSVCAGELGNPRLVDLEADHPGLQYVELEYDVLADDGSYIVNSPGVPPCVEPQGACCFADGSCEDGLLFGDCVAAGGDPQGDGTMCATANCPQPTGACCLPGGTCAELSQADCVAASGDFRGVGTDCATEVCALTGACCFTCDPAPMAPCPDASGALAADPCTDLSEADCLTAGGTYRGDGTACADTPDPCQCPGDLNGDGAVDVFDFGDLAANFGAGTPDCATRAQGDLNCDGVIDVFDFGNLAADFGCISN